MKKGMYTVGSLVILLICAFVFVLLPAFTGSSRRGEEIPAFGKYNGKEIRYEQGSDFADFVSNYGQMFQSRGQQLDSSTYYYIFNYAFNSTVMKMAYTDAVKRSGYKVPATAVNRAMVPYFLDENGEYSSKLYRQTPETTLATLRKQVSSSLTASRFYDDTFGSSSDMVGSDALYGIKESDAELDFLASLGTKKRGFNMAVFSTSKYPEEETLKYGRENSAKFVKYDMSVITCQDEAKANTLAKRLANNEITFTDAVGEYSDKIYSNTEGKLTNSFRYQLDNILEDKSDAAELDALAAGAVSRVIKTNSGYSLFCKDGENIRPDFSSEAMTGTVSSYMTSYEKGLIEDYFIARATDFTAEALASGFDTACARMNADNVEIPPFPLNYGSSTIFESVDTSLPGLALADENENFLKTAFSMKLNEFSEPLVINSSVIVLQLTSETTEQAGSQPAAFSELTSYDESSSQAAIMNSDRLENNFADVYFNNFLK